MLRLRLPRTVGAATRRLRFSTKAQALSDDEWKAKLTPWEYRVLRQKGTEPSGSGPLNKHFEKGTYVCAGCHTPLYASTHKFDSGCGWPAFYDALPSAIVWVPDSDGQRTEIVCAKCHGHMGHVFENEGFPTPTNHRHCVNSISIKFKADK
ncbi:methionine-R-sulfoxide reductase [Saprolegnia diclina VS20]|uniref:Peptide-methionine (R)-S-oxide reductase n=1 Tax=Saprolegnia diclina (strain VS20) TaxID=1156394 RepID=T0RIL7_SAPDV|nr:methionine-R-sulfoxide reductase [Saprolegnia diclina VS20]EQC29697.1 methionine-R-sulfoxide reductase [Saprolegnia diclina VS20]|eukprot:XP_008617001.1 methionine-R-sulfoxide reductase [Saprolegnia diclina VS20]